MKKSRLILILGAILVLSSCMNKLPHAVKYSTADYNKRITVTSPGYIKKENKTGIGIAIGSTAIGAAAGYQSKMIKPRNDNNSGIATAGNVAIGALVGYSVNRLITHCAGKNKITKTENPQPWLASLNKGYAFIDKQQTSKFDTWRIIDREAETSYSVLCFSDVSEFKKAFPASKYSEDMLANALDVIKRKNIPTILKMYPNSRQEYSFKKRYYESSTSLLELNNAKSLYPEVENEVDYCIPIKNFVYDLSKDEMTTIIEEYEDLECINIIKRRLTYYFKSVDDCIDMAKRLPNAMHEESAAAALNLANTLEDCKKGYDFYHSHKEQFAKKAQNIANSIKDFGFVFNNFATLSKIAEQQALSRLTSLHNKKEFLKYFKEGNYYQVIKESVESEERDIAFFTKIANKAGNQVIYSYLNNHTKVNHSIQMTSYTKQKDKVKISVEVKLTAFHGIFDREWKRKHIKATFDILYSNNESQIINFWENQDAKRAKTFDRTLKYVQKAAVKIINDFKDDFRKAMANHSYYDYSSQHNTPCYTIEDKSKNILSGDIKYKIKCKNGDTEFINYDPHKGKYTWGILNSGTSLNEAAYDACNCAIY